MKWLRSILLIIIGALSIFLGSDILGMNTGNHVGNQEYGGDAYTGIQNTEATTGFNVLMQSEIIKQVGGNTLIIGGLVMIAFAIPTKKG